MANWQQLQNNYKKNNLLIAIFLQQTLTRKKTK
jgi:hypothetical protein